MSNLDFLKKLIKIESISPNDNGCFDVIKQQFDGLNFSFEETNYKNISNLIISNGDSKDKTFCFLGHTDVVPPGPESEWTVPPFSGEIIGNKIYGRGTADMKSFIACALHTAIKSSSMTLTTPLHFAFSYDEEIGCVGVKSLIEMLKKAPFNPLFCIIGEPTSMKVAAGHKGKVNAFVKIKGKEAHSALAPNGLNSIYLATNLINEIQNKH